MYKNGRYTQTLTTGLARIYDADSGQLIGLRSTRSGDPAVAILRSRNRLPRAAALGEGKKTRPWIQLEFDDLDENVTHLTTSNAKYLAYTYSKDRDLLTAKNAWNNTYRFEYDPLHNLSQANYPDGTSEQMIYDTDHDRLLTYRGRDGCEETYTYQLASEKSADHLHQISTARLICENKHKREVRYDFHFRRSDKSWLLTNMSLTHDGTTQSTSFSISNSGGAQ